MLTTYPKATPIDEQTIQAMVGLNPKLALIGDVTTTPCGELFKFELQLPQQHTKRTRFPLVSP